MSAGIDEIAASIRAARQAKALTQKELGQRVGLIAASAYTAGMVEIIEAPLAETAEWRAIRIDHVRKVHSAVHL